MIQTTCFLHDNVGNYSKWSNDPTLIRILDKGPAQDGSSLLLIVSGSSLYIAYRIAAGQRGIIAKGQETKISTCGRVHFEKKKKRSYSKKRFWVSPICSQREQHGFFEAILPSLRLENLGFYNYFRMNSTKMEELLTLVGEDLIKQNCIRKPISPAQRLALTLRFLASGDSITSMHYQYLVGVTTASNIINETCVALWKKLQPLCMPAELKREQWLSIEEDFKEKWNFPHCIGAIDGKHIIIQCPNNAGSMYFNYKNSHSLVLLAMCDANYIFTFIDIGAYGRRSDGGIFKDSLLGQKLEENKMNIPDSTPISDKSCSMKHIVMVQLLTVLREMKDTED
ncbi:uncharacterized protein [Temnothorax nylanderi]|uniref:uncharacterized protein n=1 Tax=Temnothorax nylanderi TaxID=102681 RepID=UPI003A839AD3